MTATTSTTEPTTESPADERFVEHPLAPGRIAIHDPAIVEDNGTYYVFGTHRRCARSTDLVHWERFENNLTRDPASLLGGIWEAWPKQPENPALEGNTWAPDVMLERRDAQMVHVPVGQRSRIPFGDRAAHRRSSRRRLDIRRSCRLLRFQR
ncbi:MAG: hypothetical protein ACLRXJ_10280 [Bifidobacterium bifidum]